MLASFKKQILVFRCSSKFDMRIKYVSTVCFIMSFAYANEPAKVHEEDSSDHSSGVVRKSQHVNLSAFTPTEFIYSKAAQQDPRTRRYSQQQQADSENRSRIQGQLRKRNAPPEEGPSDQKYAGSSRPAASKTWKVVHPKFVTEKLTTDSGKKQEDARQNRTLQRRESIDLGGNSPSFYFGSLKNNPGASDVPMANYVVQNAHEEDLDALNSLLGQTPMAQLRGLQQLLHSHAVQVAPSQDHTPIKEHVDDIENPQTKPNIKVEPQPVAPVNIIHQHELQNEHAQVILQHQPNLDDLQAHLNAVSQMQANEAIAQAQQKALENVKLQHQALALAKIHAEKIALAQVQSQNIALAHVQAEAQALAQAALIHQNALHKVKEEEEDQAKENLLDRKSDQQYLALKILHQAAEEDKTRNAEAHARRQAQAYKELAAQEYAKHPHVQIPEYVHSYPTQEAAAYVQEVPQALALTQQVQETPYVHSNLEELQGHYVKPEVKTEQDDAEYNEYASKYSFGYRVRDYHSGNNFGHQEEKDGKVVRGRYDVLLPDGRIQVVEYWADPSGYHAKVSYTNVARH